MRKSISILTAVALLGAGSIATAQNPPSGAAIPNQGVIANDGVRVPIQKTGEMDMDRATVADGFTFLASGDLIGPYQPILATRDPGLEKVLDIIRKADVAFANHEASAFDLNSFNGTHAAQNGGGYPLFAPAITREFKEMGIDIVSLANNHAGDWGEQGLIATLQTLSAAGLVQAGAGGSMRQARQPGIFLTPKGRVALISTATTYNPASPAGDGNGALKPRPGISTIKTTATNVVTEEEMRLVRQLATVRNKDAPDATKVRLGGNTFMRPNNPGVVYTDASQFGGGVSAFVVGDAPRLTYQMNEDDRKAVIDSITLAKRTNDLVTFTIHAHETAGLADSTVPADFLQTLFHQAIDAGADMVIRHGPHELNGIEIYKGKPIFYSFGSLFFGVGGPQRVFNGNVQPDEYYESAMATIEYKGGKPSVIRIYPLQSVTDRADIFSAPVIATGALGQHILENIRKFSEPYGTDIQIENGIGIIRLRN